jgi:hypothetical protein
LEHVLRLLPHQRLIAILGQQQLLGDQAIRRLSRSRISRDV